MRALKSTGMAAIAGISRLGREEFRGVYPVSGGQGR